VDFVCLGIRQGSTNFPKIEEPFQNYTRQKGDMKQLPHGGPTNIRLYRKQLSSPGCMTPGIYPPLVYSVSLYVLQKVCKANFQSTQLFIKTVLQTYRNRRVFSCLLKAIFKYYRRTFRGKFGVTHTTHEEGQIPQYFYKSRDVCGLFV
jgi:hypothetical protein